MVRYISSGGTREVFSRVWVLFALEAPVISRRRLCWNVANDPDMRPRVSWETVGRCHTCTAHDMTGRIIAR